MLARLQSLLRTLDRLEKLFLILLAVYLTGSFAFPRSGFQFFLTVALYFTGAAVLYRLAKRGMKRLIWRLRNRLLVVYMFIAVVPVVLILSLVGFAAWLLTGQVAVYMVTTELDRRTSALLGPVYGGARSLTPAFRERFPGLELLVRSDSEWRYPRNASITSPPAGWGEASGLVFKDGALYLWVHSLRGDTETTLLAPMTDSALAELLPNLGEVALLLQEASPAAPAKAGKKTEITFRVGDKVFKLPARDLADRVPPPVNRFDREVMYFAPVPVAMWQTPNRTESRVLVVITRYSAVLRALFGQNVELSPGFPMSTLAAWVFAVVTILFLIFELVSLIIGIRLTRTITGAVHELYQGTQKVRVGDFSHRIEVHGNDQLGELSQSFNRMTENLQRLLEVAKEKERLQSELEIAREVQSQLFPKSIPASRTLELAAVCHPARTVSGDYYDFLSLEQPKLALAIGDVAGKGISAALLMATVQSTMRTQFRAGRELAAAAGNDGGRESLSTAALVSRLNQQLYDYTPPEKFATFYVAVYDDSTGLMTYTNAGHLPPVLLRNGRAQRLEVTGTIVGAFPFSEYEEASLQLERGDLLVCFTDGVTEPENEYGEMFGEDRLIELVLKNSHRESQDIMDSVMDAVREWTGSPELQDDMTMLLARRS
jgi:sigma-B regulation protein RsbU (phosphoserine phosphatase)